MIYETNYVLDCSVGTNFTVQKGLHFALDTMDWCNIIRRNALPFGWQWCIDTQGEVPLLNDANGQQFSLTEMVSLSIRFGIAHYVLKFVIEERLAVDVIIGTAFLNYYVIEIRCR